VREERLDQEVFRRAWAGAGGSTRRGEAAAVLAPPQPLLGTLEVEQVGRRHHADALRLVDGVQQQLSAA